MSLTREVVFIAQQYAVVYRGLYILNDYSRKKDDPFFREHMTNVGVRSFVRDTAEKTLKGLEELRKEAPSEVYEELIDDNVDFTELEAKCNELLEEPF